MEESGSWVGKQIDQYRVEEHIAKGGMADVYLAHDVELGRDVCLKVLLLGLLQRQQYRERFQREARAIAALSHPNIVRIYGTGTTPAQQPYIAMEYVEGGSLRQWINSLADRGMWLMPADILLLIRQVAVALEAAHRERIVHRDLKPDNILIRHDGTPVVADLGIAAVEEATRLTGAGPMPGTPPYMSPEQIRGEKVDGRSDIYTLGIILYELLGGQWPFDGPDANAIMKQHLTSRARPLSQIRPGLAAATYKVVKTCLQKNPAKRYQTASELVDALAKAIEAERQGKISVWTRLPPPWPIGVVTLIAFAVLLLLRWGMRNFSTSPPRSPVATRIPLPSDTPPSLVIAVAPATSTSSTPVPNTAAPTSTPTPEAPTPTATDTATSTPSPVSPPPIVTLLVATDTPCAPLLGPRWGQGLYLQYQLTLGCPLNSETATAGAYQQYPGGLTLWRQDINYVYVLYADGSFSQHDAAGFSTDYPQDELHKGAFGYLWFNDGVVRSRLGDPSQIEAETSELTAQDFTGGTLFSFQEGGDNTYILFKNTGRWVRQGN